MGKAIGVAPPEYSLAPRIKSLRTAYPLTSNLSSRNLVQRNNKAVGSMDALFSNYTHKKGLISMSITNRLLTLWCIHMVHYWVAVKKKKVIAIVYRCLEELLIIYIPKYQH